MSPQLFSAIATPVSDIATTEGLSAPPFHEAAPGRTSTRWASWVMPALNDKRDVVFVNLGLAMIVTMWPAAFYLFAMGTFSWWFALAYAALFGVWFDRFTLMLHCVSHRPLFRGKFRALNHIVVWGIGPVFGQTPNSYFVHHMGMHHKEGNLPGDLSSTMRYQRDKLSHWLHYWGKFMLRGLPDLTVYHHSRGRSKMVKKLLLGELAYWSMCALLAAFVSWQATLIVFVAPVLIMRTLMMAGNWGQHAFVDPATPDCDFRSSITCINSRYNRRCFNDGYHIIHHLKPALHYTEMADEFDKNRALYGKEDAIVFEGVDFFVVWLLLMTGQKKALAKRFVRLPGAPARTDDEVIELMNRRLRPFDQAGKPLPL